MPTPATMRDDLMAALRDEQHAAQQRAAWARERGDSPDPFDRDIAGWLASGLCDLFADPITAEVFLRPEHGIIARLAAGSHDARFAESDFLRPEGIKFLEASRPAQSMLTKLSMISTNQFRAAAAKLMNRIADRLQAPAVAIPEPLPAPAPSVEEAPAVEVVPPPVPSLEELPGVEAAPPKVETKPPRERLSVEFFVDAGLVERGDLPTSEEELRLALVAAWKNWFAHRINYIDAEEFLAFEEVERFYPTIARLHDKWTANESIEPVLPRSERDIALAEAMFEELRWLRHEWTMTRCTPWDEGPSFDAAVEAGGAPLSMLTKGVKYWLKKENKDWKKYKIVKLD